jgi:NAD(P)-dependent dehydrogenase (short-subunit alcohol dehydrogenase family)
MSNFTPPSPHVPVALVTGAGERIGAAIALALAQSGYAVIAHYRRNADGAQRVVAQIESGGGRAMAIQADLADRSQRAHLVADAARPFGPLTTLINNASIYERDSARDLDEALWDAHFAIHAEAPAFLSRDFAAQLPAGVSGNIINIIDERVLDLSPAYFSYTLSKSVLWTMTRTLAQSLAPAIRVNAVAPGPAVAPPAIPLDKFDQRRAELPLQTAADANGIAQGVIAILGLASMTGQMLALDGGEHLEFPAHRRPTPRS